MTNRGVNLDLLNPTARPTASELRGMTWARFPINMQQGATDPNLYRGYIRDLHGVGVKTIAVLAHQLWGEGRGFDFGDRSARMTHNDWTRYFEGNIAEARRVFAGVNPDSVVLQIFNEITDANGRASVIVPADQYGRAFRMYREAFPQYKLATAGYNQGAGNDLPQMLAAGVLPLADYVCHHSYGQSANGINHVFGRMIDQINHWKTRVPAHKLLGTEFGVHVDANLSDEQLATYARGCFQAFAGTAGGVWFAWGVQDNHEGVVKPNGARRTALRAELNTSGGAVTPPPVIVPPTTPPAAGSVQVLVSGTSLNVRAAAGTRHAVVGSIRSGDRVTFGAQAATLDRHVWVDVELANGVRGWVAMTAALVRLVG